jgi:hypothetical protein
LIKLVESGAVKWHGGKPKGLRGIVVHRLGDDHPTPAVILYFATRNLVVSPRSFRALSRFAAV